MTEREQEVGVFPMVIGGEFTPHVASKIFCLLDKSALLTCRKVSREWRNLVDLETKLWSEIPPARYGEAAESGRLEICRLIIGRVVTKNPATEKGWTPLHRAALKGHLNICRLIIQGLHDKNPGQVTALMHLLMGWLFFMLFKLVLLGSHWDNGSNHLQGFW